MKSTTIFLLPALASAYTLQFFSDNHCQNDMVDHSAPDDAPGTYGDCVDIGIVAKSIIFREDGPGLLYLAIGNKEEIGEQCVNSKQWLEPDQYLDDSQLQEGCYDTTESQADQANTGYVQYQVGSTQ
ncbi:hypothetical protein PRZ48_010604 [Zasmidium cellare]|uniref:Uncharacterized protein n=1 Tax=Zasmidium cellare TaxID=395010 RepID=A0ABR0E9K3_ZASCE|nr:hypothetical protein PRZ48_010604 [Zasmidium cellare]